MVDSDQAEAEPVLAVSSEEMTRLRDGLERIRARLTVWQTELARR
jgi:hypothetical protein